VMWNKNYRDIYGFPLERVRQGMSLMEVCNLSTEYGNHPGTPPEQFFASYSRELLQNRSGARSKSRERLSGGRIIESAHVFSPGLGWVVTHEDVTEEIASSEIVQERKRQLEKQNLRLDAAVNNISQGLCMYDAKGRLVICNAPYARIYDLPDNLLRPGTQLEEILGYLFDKGMSSGGDREGYLNWRRDVIARQEYGKTVHTINGRIIVMQHHPMADGGWVSTHEDITEQRQIEEQVNHLVRYDTLTDLPNRMHFLEEMERAETALLRGEKAAVLSINLDHFKAVNDTMGHAVGDAVLRQAAARLLAATRTSDVLARLAGDEFALLLRPIDSPVEAAGIAEQLIMAIAAPFEVNGKEVLVGASVGIAMAPGDGASTDALMKNADLALHKAKREGRSVYHFFEPGMDASLQRRRVIEAGLQTALQRQELHLVYQPLIRLKDNAVSCFEALLRWDHPVLGAVSPAEFIPVAEETGIIVPIGEWVLRQACAAATSWPGDIRVAVNLSPIQFKNRNLADLVQTVLDQTGLAPHRLELEITESLLLADSEPVLATLHGLRSSGIRIAMDDFGTGYSSLSYLRSFPFDKIKIDRSFMRGLTGRDDDMAIIKAIVGLGHSLGMSTTAEGIETKAQLDAVREQGCDEVQGFYFSRPIHPEAIGALLKNPIGTGPSSKVRQDA
jgi:diguanylate cyclase (GGDEF)-like protein